MSLEDFKIEHINKVSAYEIREELLNFYIDFLIKNEILFADSLEELKGKFHWARFQAFT
jgi:hypothetical protein